MSRALIYKTLNNDPVLTSLGLHSAHPNYSLDVSPTRERPFILYKFQESKFFGILRSGNDGTGRGARIMTVTVHLPKERYTDYGPIDLILDRVAELFAEIEDMPGEDGYTITCIRHTGNGEDGSDPGFNTITRNSAFEMLARRS